MIIRRRPWVWEDGAIDYQPFMVRWCDDRAMPAGYWTRWILVCPD